MAGTWGPVLDFSSDFVYDWNRLGGAPRATVILTEAYMTTNVVVKAEFFQEDDRVIGICPELKVSSFGGTKEEAKKSLEEALSLFLEECERMGTLADVLEEAGFVREEGNGGRWVLRQPVAREEVEVSMTV